MLIEFKGVPAVVLIALFLFHVLKKHNEAMAPGYVSFRLLVVRIINCCLCQEDFTMAHHQGIQSICNRFRVLINKNNYQGKFHARFFEHKT